MMKKLVKWVAPVFLGILPTWSADGKITDPFFTNPGTKVSIKSVYESGPNVMALVEADDSKGKPVSIRVAATCVPNGWEMDDTTRLYREKVLAKVTYGKDTIEQSYTLTQEVPYPLTGTYSDVPFINSDHVKPQDLLPGMKATLHTMFRYQRPDKKTVDVKSAVIQDIIAQIFYNGKVVEAVDFLKEPEGTLATVAMFSLIDGAAATMLRELYPVIRTVDTGPTVDFLYCEDHQQVNVGSKKNKKWEWQHTIKKYAATPSTIVIRRTPVDTNTAPILAGATDTPLALQSEKKGQKNCTTHNSGTGLPAGHHIVVAKK